MAKKAAPPPSPVVKQFHPDEIAPAITKLQRRLGEVEAIKTDTLDPRAPELDALKQSIRNTILEVYGAQSPEYLEHQYLDIWHGPMSMGMQEWAFKKGVVDGLGAAAVILKSLIAQLEEKRSDLQTDPAQRVRGAFEGLTLHPRIAAVSVELFRDGHYRNAVLDAAVVIINMVKEKSRVHDRDGVPLMRHVFSLSQPHLVFNALADQSDKDEQEGMMQLFAGAVQALRNPRAHDVVPDTAEYALECLGFLSFLAKHVDRARRPPAAVPAQTP
jgi:uncharacterized protein (TIGR02391 family)